MSGIPLYGPLLIKELFLHKCLCLLWLTLVLSPRIESLLKLRFRFLLRKVST